MTFPPHRFIACQKSAEYKILAQNYLKSHIPVLDKWNISACDIYFDSM